MFLIFIYCRPISIAHNLSSRTLSSLADEYNSHFYGTQIFITMLTISHQWTPSCAMCIQYALPHTHFSKINFIIILPSVPLFPKWPLLSVPLTKMCVPPSPFHACYISCPSYPLRFHAPSNIRFRILLIVCFLSSYPSSA